MQEDPAHHAQQLQEGPQPPREVGSSTRKRPSEATSGELKYPRKRSVRACHLCRARKTKCDNGQPRCSFCVATGCDCIYDDTLQTDNSSFDPATQAILRKLGQLIESQTDLIHLVRSVHEAQSGGNGSSHNGVPPAPRETPGASHSPAIPLTELSARRKNLQQGDAFHSPDGRLTRSNMLSIPTAPGQSPYPPFNPDDVVDHHEVEAGSSITSASGNSAAIRWFGLVATDAVHAVPEAESEADMGWGFLHSHDNNGTTPLQRATKIIDENGQEHRRDPKANDVADDSAPSSRSLEPRMWQAQEDIRLLPREQTLFQTYLQRICPWLDQFDPRNTFSSVVPRLALRNAGLMNAMLALSCQYLTLQPDAYMDRRPDSTTALQYYNQTLHYVQKAMQYSSYQISSELIATTIFISFYEMLGNSRKDWERHLQGVFWILRSKLINVETDSLESAAWWAWLRQDVWAAFREGRRPYTTWTPTKTLASLTPHELALRSIWILAQVVGYCSPSASSGESEARQMVARLERAEELQHMLDDWNSHLTDEFVPFPAAAATQSSTVFQPLLIHPPCFGLAIQLHYVAKILLCFNEPCLGGVNAYLDRTKMVQSWIRIVCGLGMTLVDEASSVISSQCLFIVGMFLQDHRERECVIEMLDSCKSRTGWPRDSLEGDLRHVWSKR